MVTLEEIRKKLEDMKTLEIRTVIGEFEQEKENGQIKGKILPTQGKSNIIITRIDLLEGDITTAFSEKFLEPPYDKIRE